MHTNQRTAFEITMVAAAMSLTLIGASACGDDSGIGNNNQNGNNASGRCGNGVREGAEECDDGAENSDSSPDACRTDCTSHRCGDGVLDSGEVCDEGAGNSDSTPDACRADCTPPRCGDGVADTEHGETCDCGETEPLRPARCNYLNGALLGTCAESCAPVYCGNGVLEDDRGEECDDGNNAAADGCGPTCLTERCGNGFVDPGEGCDRGADNSDDPDSSCRTDCQPRACGDGITDVVSGEECDGDATVISATCADFGYYQGVPTCNALCRVDSETCSGRCGDGVADLVDGETCDGSDLGGRSCLDYDYYGGELSCQSNCQVALGQCAGRCGDGAKNGAELCDGADFGSLSCADYGFYTGSLQCASDCQTVTPLCEQHCGDGTVNGLEQCDGDALDGAYCVDLVTYEAGRLHCNEECERKLGYCFAPGWRSQITPTSNTLRGVWGSSDDNIYAVGDGGTILWNRGGASWKAVISGTTVHLKDVWGTGADDIYAVGESGTVLHFDGTTWLPLTPPVAVNLNGVWCASSTDVWVVGDGGTVLRYNGQAWSAVDLGLTDDLHAVWGAASDNVFVAGDAGRVRRFNGTGWDTMDDSSSVRFLDIDGLDADHVWAVGRVTAGDDYEHIRFYDGSTWTTQLTQGTGAGRWAYRRAVWAVHPSLAFSAGKDLFSRGLLRRFDGAAWPSEPGTTTLQIMDLWGTSSRHVVAVGEQGYIHRFGGDGEGWALSWTPTNEGRDVVMFSDTLAYAANGDDILKWDGQSWSVDFSVANADADFKSLWAQSQTSIYALANEKNPATGYDPNYLYHYDGGGWAPVAGAPSMNNAYKMFGLPSGHLYLLDDYGSGHTWDGHSWSTWSVNSDCDIGISMWASSPSDIWVVGRKCVTHFDGTSWTKLIYPPAWLNHVTGSGPNDVWAFGANGLVYHWDGHQLTEVSVPSGEELYGGWVTPQGEVFAGGSAGSILWFDGEGWSPMASHTGAVIRAIHGVSRNHMLAVGNEFLEFTGELPMVPYCGNGNMEPALGEECDDGNRLSGDGCEPDCRLGCGAETGANRGAFESTDGRCLVGFHTPTSWLDAEAHCQSLGGALVAVGDAAENSLVATVAGGDAWIGLNDRGAEGTFVWSSGETVTDTFWNSGEPNNSGDEDCTELRVGTMGWNDEECGALRSYVCELSRCGDGSLQLVSGEECDDGNLVAGDGCASNCTCEQDCHLGSCAAILAAGQSQGDGVYYIDPVADGRVVHVYCDMTTQGGGWTLVRRTHPGASGHYPMNDNLAGSASLGTYEPDPLAEATFSLQFDQVSFTEMRFSTGDGAYWLYVDRDQAQQGFVSGGCGQTVTVTASHLHATPHTVLWCKRTANAEDPWISATDHTSATESEAHSMLYGEARNGGWTLYRTTHGGLNVWVR